VPPLSAVSETAHLRCPECRAPAASPGARLCADHGLYLLTPEALAALDEAPLLGQILDGKYALVGLLGGGGYGSVCRGLQQPLGREVAVKVLHGLALSLKLGRDRFEREALALSRLSSPHTVRLIDFGITQTGPIGVRNLPYMVMELISGEDLERRLRRGPMHPDDLIEVLEGVADSLAEAHAAGIIHRDLKPSNVILTRSHTGRVVPKVIDFGIARIEGASKSQTGFVTGTPSYMAPEQVRGEAELDARVDVYALAAMTFELLTGRPPYLGNDPVAILTQHCVAPIPTLQATMPAAPGLWVLDAPLGAGLAKARADRPGSVTALVAALRTAWSARDRALAEVAPPRIVPISSAPVHALAPPTVPAAVVAPGSEPDRRPSSGTMAYASPPSGDAPRPVASSLVAAPGLPEGPPDALAPSPDEGPTAARLPTPLTLSNLPGTTAPPGAGGRRRRLTAGVLVAAAGVVAAAVGLLVLTRPSKDAPAVSSGVPEPAAVAVAAPSPPTTVESVPSPAAPPPPPSIVSTPAPASVASSPAPASVVSAPATVMAVAAAAPRTPPARAPITAAPRPDAEDRPAPAPVVDGRAKATAAELDAAIDECRCLPAQRLLGVLKGLPGGPALAAPRAARVGACRPVDVDHTCVHGRLVEIE
jgi:serine/threonine-protein kinase